MKELEILGQYLVGDISEKKAIEKITSILSKVDDSSKYTPIIRCIKCCENDFFFDFCGHLRQALGNFKGSVVVGKEMYKKILPYKSRYGFILSGNGTYEINIQKEMLSNVDDLKSAYRFEKRKNNPASISNGAVKRYFQYNSFTSLQQKMMMYFVANMKQNQTLLACLPTGGGKSFTWQFSAVAESFPGCTIVVVPTIALAINHEESAEELFKKIDGFSKTARAYHSELGSDRKQLIYEELDNDKLSLLFVSPEALLAKEFKNKVLNAAGKGKISALFVDEVHLVVSWGMKFRPEFQLLPSLRNEMQRISPTGIKTILLSATITEHDKNTIERLFGRDGILEYRADELRPEFDYYAHECKSVEEREELVKRIVDQAPKPMIIYTVTPAIAERYYRILKENGYERIEVFTGNTNYNERLRIISSWNNDNTDIIVATSAFGMGVDKADVRTIVTTYIPESVSRFYQEVGRAGRDGYSALNYWLFNYSEDDKIIKNLTDTALLTEKRLSERWDSLYKKAKRVSSDRIRIRMDSMPEDMKGNPIGKQHANWNKDAVLLLYREGIIDIVDLQFITHLEYEIEAVLNNIPVLEDRNQLEEYIEDFREEERQSIKEDKNSVYTMMQYYKEECFSTFFTKEFPFAPDSCLGCPYCRSKNRGMHYFPQSIYGNNLEMTRNSIRIGKYSNIYMNNFLERGMSLITYQDELDRKRVNVLTEILVRYGVECIVREEWDDEVLIYLMNIDRANYVLLSYEEFDKINSTWIAGPIVFFLSSDNIRNNEIFNLGRQIEKQNQPVIFVANGAVRIECEEKTLKELSNYNVSLDNLIEGEY